jgi:hypothetical protein
MVSASRINPGGDQSHDALMRGKRGTGSAQFENSLAGPYPPDWARLNLRSDGFTSSFVQTTIDGLALLVCATLAGAFVVSIVSSFYILIGIHL